MTMTPKQDTMAARQDTGQGTAKQGTARQQETTIRIPGLINDLTLMHVTDCHLTECDERETAAIREAARNRAKVFADQLDGGDTTLGIFQRFIDDSNEQQVDFTVFTGDIIDFPSQANLETIRAAYDRLNSPFLYTLGNHDWYFDGRFTDEVRAEAYPQFRDWISTTPGCDVRTVGGVKLIALDNSNYQVTREQFETIREAAALDEPYLLFMHIPMYLSGLVKDVVDKWKAPILMGASGWDPEVREAWQVRHQDESTGEFCRWLASPDSGNIRGIFCGHVHLNHTDAFREGRYQYVTASGYTSTSRLIRLIAD
ncbi:metallophosphoesterase family protein [Paenibacillus sacheonensis]|nr:metallophosphoesterase [Paenibacillus sacheonensis]